MAGYDLYSQIGKGVRSVGDYDRDFERLQADKLGNQANQAALLLNQQKADEYTRGVAEQNALRQALAGATTTEDRIERARRTGTGAGFALAAGEEKGLLERQKTGAEVGAKKAAADKDTYETGRKRYEHRIAGLSQFQDAEGAKQWLADSVHKGDLGMDEATRMIQKIPGDPAAFGQWKNDTIFSLNDAAKQAGYIRPDANATLSAQTSTANNTATNARMATEGEANRAVTIRGQDKIDAREMRKITQSTAEAADASAPVLGVPVPKVFPWANQSRDIDKNKVKAAEVRAGGKLVDKDIEHASKEAGAAADAKRFLELNSRVNTGGISDKIPGGQLVQSMGSDYAEMQAITAKLAPMMRATGSGSTSDYDIKQFERATVGVDKPNAANKNIAAGIMARAQQAQDYADFRTTYLEQNGTLVGSDRHWKQYVAKNPIFDPKAKAGSFTLNTARQPWKDYFATTADAPAASAPRPPSPIGQSSRVGGQAPAAAAPAAGPTVSNW
jgi:hypothetical protein